MSASGVDVSWPFKGDAWAPVITLIETVGIDAMVSYAVRASARTAVFSARYFVAGWTELPPKPPEGTPDHRPRLRAVGGQHYISPEERGIF
ncbi:hypothetical protein [Streptomyces lonarensis]|nr:hypothetical protein [Streptomyces lonarensis]